MASLHDLSDIEQSPVKSPTSPLQPSLCEQQAYAKTQLERMQRIMKHKLAIVKDLKSYPDHEDDHFYQNAVEELRDISGAIVSYFNNFFTKREVRILVLGLDNAGKTTVLYALQLGEPIKTEPTYGFNCEIISCKNLNFRVFDLSGETSARPYWSCFFQNTDAIIYVVDSTDKFRMEICRRELFFMLEKKELEKAVLVVLANKQDIPTALTLPEIFEELGLVLLRDRTFRIFETSAIEGKGVEEAMEWLISKLAVNESIWDKLIKL